MLITTMPFYLRNNMMHHSNQNGHELLSTSLVNHDNGKTSAPSLLSVRNKTRATWLLSVTETKTRWSLAQNKAGIGLDIYHSAVSSFTD